MYNNIFVICNIYHREMGMVSWESFLLGAGNLMRSDFDLLKLKTTFCKYGTPIKITIGMICL